MYKTLKLCDPSNLPVSDDIFQLLQFNIDEEIESSFPVKNQIHIQNNTRSNNQMSPLRVNRPKTKYSVLHNGMMT